MEKLLTTISKDYIPDWGISEGFRELLQNGLDSNDQGNKLVINYLREEQQLRISNCEAALDKKSLLLGVTNKRDTNQRGSHGEGFKVGILALHREGKLVEIWDGINNQKISCSFEKHPAYEDTEVLCFNLEHQLFPPALSSRLTFVIHSLTSEEYKELAKTSLELIGLDFGNYHRTKQGKILLQDQFKGKIFVGGLYVSTNKELDYGYDFNVDEVALDRDRKLVSDFDIQWKTSQMWSLISKGKDQHKATTIELVTAGSKDTRFLDSFSSREFASDLTDKFVKDNGELSYPVTSEYEAKQVKELGFAPVISSGSLTSNVRKKLGSIEEIKQSHRLNHEEIEVEPNNNISWALRLISDSSFNPVVKTVKFKNSEVSSGLVDGSILISIDIYNDKFEILHEIIKHYSSDFDKEPTKIWMSIFKHNLDE